MPLNYQPLHDRVIVKRAGEEEQVRGGIIIPEVARERSQTGEVVAIGPGKRNRDGIRIPLDVCVGDHVLFGQRSGSEIRPDDSGFLIMREEEILARLN